MTTNAQHPDCNPNSIAFIDSSLPDLQIILSSLEPSVTAFVLDPAQDGIQQMADALVGMANLDAIHIISHGASGQLKLGTAQLTQDNLAHYQSQLAAIGQSLSATGDLLLYGCNVAEGITGQSFIQQLATMTGADVAASDDLTGAALLGGNWVLEAGTGAIGSLPVFSAETLASYEHALYTPNLVGSYATLGSVRRVTINDSRAYLADWDNGLQIVDISNPTNPTLTGAYDTPHIARSVAVSGHYAYVADSGSGLLIVDANNPTSPVQVGSYLAGGSAYDVTINDHYAYVTDGIYGLRIIDINSPASPSLVGTYDTPGTAWDITLKDDYAYIADEYSGLQIINISNPAAPMLVGSYDTFGAAYGVAVKGDYAYVGDWDYGLQVINISNPTTPTLAGSFNTAGNASDVVVEGNTVYLADDTDGLLIFDVGNPASPALLNSYNPLGNTYGLDINGHYAYMADFGSGLQIVQISSNTAPTGNVTISGTSAQGQILTAANTLADVDGLDLISYQWEADNVNIGTGKTFMLTAAQVGKAISVTASYTDLKYTVENVASAATVVVSHQTNAAPSFAVGDGKLTTDFHMVNDEGHGVAVQPDGKILVVGGSYDASNFSFALARYNIDGSLDSGFATGGKSTASAVWSDSGDWGNSLILQPDGKVIVAGLRWGAGLDFFLARYKSDGSLDPGFGTNGMLNTHIGGNDRGQSVILQTDGKILVAGSTDNSFISTVSEDFALVRYNANGTLDSSFGTNGQVTTIFGIGNEEGFGVAQQTDGKILVAGSSNVGSANDFALARYNTDGSLDTSFGTDGKLTTDFSADDDVAQSVVVQADNKILVAGYSWSGSHYNFALARYNTDGSLDTSFDTDGKLTTDFPTAAYDFGYSATLQPNGKILVAGKSESGGGGYNFALARYNTDGSQDTSFDTDGGLITDFSGGNDSAESITLQSDGKILAAGTSNNGTNDDFALVRYNSDGSLDPSFDAINTLNGTPSYTEGDAAVVLDADVQIYDAEFAAVGSYNNAALYLNRNGGANTQDVFTAKVGGTLGTLNPDGNLVVNNIPIGTVHSNSGGYLALYFNSNNATQSLVNEVMRQIAYSNTADAPPASVQIDWAFVDGNGGGGATGGTTVAITGVNDVHTGKVSISGTATQGRILTATNNLADADGLGLITYQWKADNVNIGTGNTFMLTAAQVGKAISVTARYTDLQNTAESASSSATAAVAASANTAPSFAVGDGKRVMDLGGADTGRAVVQQLDGKLVAAGYSGSDFALARYSSDGSLDTSFDSDGMQITDLTVGSSDKGYSLLQQTDGKLVVGGTSESFAAHFALARYNSDGSLDTSFGSDGKLATTLGGDNHTFGYSIVQQTDSKLVVAGSFGIALDYAFALARYNSNGSLDTTFDGDGMLATDFGGTDGGAFILQQTDGKLVVVGSSSSNFALARYLSDGSLDSSFDGDGKVTTDVLFTDLAYSAVQQADGKLVVAGYSGDNFGLARYNSDGSLDATFDGDGKLTTDLGGSDSARFVVQQADGKLVAGGYSGINFALVRYNTNGSLDITFDNDGKLTTDFGNTTDYGYSLLQQADSSLVLVGESNGDFALARYHSDGSLDASFDTSNTLDGSPSFTEGGTAVVLDANVQIYDAQLAATGNYAGASLTLARNGGAKTQDVFSTKAGGNLGALTQDGNLMVGATPIGTVTTNSGGSLALNFNSAATQSLVNSALQQIAYRNTADAPSASAQINWTFNDDNNGNEQGSSGALNTTGSTTVTITGVNDVHTGTVSISGTATQGQILTATNTLVDADGLGLITYQWQANGVNIGIGNTLMLTAAQVGKTISVTASYTDLQNTTESETSNATAVVAAFTNTAPSFAVGDGKLTTNFHGSNESPSYQDDAQSVMVQADGKILMMGLTRWNGLALVRYNADGSLDSSFGTGGQTLTGNWGNSAVLQPDGKIVVAGTAIDDFSVERFLGTGTLDVNFATDGKLTTNFGSLSGNSDFGQSVTIQTDGKIVVAGHSLNNAGNYDFALARYTSNGSLDLSFDTDGKLTTHFGLGNDQAYSVAVQTDGKILVAGFAVGHDNDFALARYNTDGSLDDSFGTDGKLTTDFGFGNDQARSVVVQPDGRILLGGFAYNGHDSDFALVRYNTDGSLDNSFHTGGKLISNFSTGNDAVYSIALQPDGRILVAGDNNSDFALVRYNADGSWDLKFDADGKVTTDFGTTPDTAHSVVLQSDGKLLVAGRSGSNADSAFALARYNTDGSLDLSFDASNTLDGTPSFIEGGTTVVLDDNVQIYDAELAATGNYAGASLTLGRKDAANVQDVFVAKTGGTLGVLTQGGNLLVGGIIIGAVTGNANGALILGFNNKATQNLLNTALQQIAYRNTADAPPATVEINWTFNDGNNGSAQGNGVALTTTGSTTVSIIGINDLPTGTVSINGIPSQGQTLTAITTLADADGLGVISYQWKAAGIAISGATGTAYMPSQADVGKAITVTASYTDVMLTKEQVTSAATAVTANVNDAPTGAVIITGMASQGQVLTVSNTLADADGLGAITYQWKAAGVAINGAAAPTYTLSQAEVGKTVTVTASYTDVLLTAESVTSAATTAVANVNDAPTGTVSITGTPTQGQPLTVSNTLADADGLGNITYQWKSAGIAINGATGTTYTPSQAGIGKAVTVTASYTDALLTKEQVTSDATDAVANVNDAPTGAVIIKGTPAQGRLLTASNTLADADGLGNITYQWNAAGIAIEGATEATYKLAQAEVGKPVTVTASYTDAFFMAESVASAATAAVANVNDTPTLTAFTSAVASGNEDSEITVSFANLQTRSNEADIDGTVTSFTIKAVSSGSLKIGTSAATAKAWYPVTNNTIDATHIAYWTPSANANGSLAAFTVVAKDDGGLESKNPIQATITITPVNDVPTGKVTITGIAVIGETLTASNTLADADGMGAIISYLWKANGITVGTGKSHQLTGAELEKTVTVIASYTDKGNTVEKVSSAATAAVAKNYTDLTIYGDKGGSKADVLVGASGNDTLYGLNMNDKLSGNEGNDTLFGGYGADFLVGGTGNDVLSGGDGDLAVDTMIGGAGNDTYYLGYGVSDVITDKGLPTDIDTVIMPYQLTSYTLPKGIEKGTISVGTQASNLTGNDSDNTLTGNDGNNSLSGEAGRDSLFGGIGNDLLSGGAGNDSLDGGDGADHLEGGNGNDVVVAGKGNDEIIGGNGTGDDTYSGGAGIDTVKYTSAITGITVKLAEGTASGKEIDNDQLNGIENIIGGQSGDTLTGDVGNNVLDGYIGNDILIGGAGKDTLVGGLGNDTYLVNDKGDVVTENSTLATESDTVNSSISYILGANLENLTLTGTATINGTGNALDNVLTGNASANSLSGGAGVDRLAGGLGADQFKFSTVVDTGITATTRDSIVDFNHNQGDKINLSAIDADTTLAGNNAFSAPTVGGAFSGVFANKGELYFDQAAHVLYGNNDTDSAADFSILLTGMGGLVALDLVL